jgi:hypothetical protein
LRDPETAGCGSGTGGAVVEGGDSAAARLAAERVTLDDMSEDAENYLSHRPGLVF